MHLAQGRDQWRAILNTVLKFQVPKNMGHLLTSRVIVNFSVRTLLHGVR